MEEKVMKKRYFIGFIASLIGALVGAIPWVLLYVYGQMIYSLLAVVIAIGSYYGYKVVKAKVDKKLPIIIATTSLMAVTISTFIIIPILLINNENVPVDINNMKLLYGDSEFISALFRDYAISVLFTILGISGIIGNLKRQISNGKKEDEIKIIGEGQINNVNPQELEMIKSIFINNGAIDKNTVISKKMVIDELKTQIEERRAIQIFNSLKYQQIIKKSKGNYYFLEKAEYSALYRNGILVAKILIPIIIFLVIITLWIINTAPKSKKSNHSSKNYDNISNNISNYETRNSDEEYDFGIDDMTFVPTSDLLILTDSEIEKNFPNEDADNYEFIARNKAFTKVIYSFIVDKTEYEEDITVEDFLRYSINTDQEIQIKDKKISGYEFKLVKLNGLNGAKSYIEECYVYDSGDKLICFDYRYYTSQSSNFDQMIKSR